MSAPIPSDISNCKMSLYGVGKTLFAAQLLAERAASDLNDIYTEHPVEEEDAGQLEELEEQMNGIATQLETIADKIFKFSFQDNFSRGR